MKKLLLIISSLATCYVGQAHPGIGIVTNAKGDIFYSDLARVWKIQAGNNTKTIVVPNVHTHELFIDKQGNLYGEYLWYEGETSNKWGHFVWQYTAKGKFTKVVPDTEGFLNNYSFTHDASGNMYWIERSKKESLFMKRSIDDSISIIKTLKTTDVRWQYCHEDSTFYYIDDNDLFKIKDGKTCTVALNLAGISNFEASTKPNHSVYGIWADNTQNVYIAITSTREIRKVMTNGTISVAYKSPIGWSPTGGLSDKDGNLWILENNPANEVRVMKVNSAKSSDMLSEKTDAELLLFNISYLFLGASLLIFLVLKFPVIKSKPLRFIFQTIFFAGLVSLSATAQNSGLAVGTDAPAFDPYHVSGKDKGSKTCPMCKYGNKTDGLMIWINDDLQNYEEMLRFLEAQYLTKSTSKWKTFVIFMNPNHESSNLLKQKLDNFARKLELKNVALTFINSPTDAETAGIYEINPKVKNTVFMYKKRIITRKIINFNSTGNNLSTLLTL